MKTYWNPILYTDKEGNITLTNPQAGYFIVSSEFHDEVEDNDKIYGIFLPLRFTFIKRRFSYSGHEEYIYYSYYKGFKG